MDTSSSSSSSSASVGEKRNAFAALMAGSAKTDGGTKSTKQQKREDAVESDAAAVEKVLSDLGARPASDFTVCIISKGRSANVKKMRAACGKDVEPTFVVAAGEEEAYRAAGAVKVVEGGKLCASRNKCIALAAEEGKTCLEMSDDLKDIKILHQAEGVWKKPEDLSAANKMAKEDVTILNVSAVDAARYLDVYMRRENTKLGGAFPTPNEGQAMMPPPTSQDLFVVGDFLVVDPEGAPRFDELMTLKEDYDLTAQHLATYGKITRCNRLIVVAEHYENPGGAVADRAQMSKEDRKTVPDPKEQYNIAVLRHKWPGVFPQHGTRGVNEVRMAWNMRGKQLKGKEEVKRPPKPADWEGTVVDMRPTAASFFGKPAATKSKQPKAAVDGSSSSAPLEA